MLTSTRRGVDGVILNLGRMTMGWRFGLQGLFRVWLVDQHKVLLALCGMVGDFSIARHQSQVLTLFAIQICLIVLLRQDNSTDLPLWLNRYLSWSGEHFWGHALLRMKICPSSHTKYQL
jgi:hypothetical protein